MPNRIERYTVGFLYSFYYQRNKEQKMNIYLAIITTVLVITQLIRITQNHIQLRRQSRKIDKAIGWIKDNDVSQRDFEVQREVFYLLRDKLKGEENVDTD